jgi:hypothetical protein
LNQVLLVAELTVHQMFRRTQTWVFCVSLIAVQGILFALGDRTMGALYQNVTIRLIYAYLPIVALASIVSAEIESGRLIMVRSAGIGSASFILGRIIGAVTILWGSLLIPLGLLGIMCLFAGAGALPWKEMIWIGLANLILALYFSSLMTFLSVIFPSWGNAAAMFVLSAVSPIIVFLMMGKPGLSEIIWYFHRFIHGPVDSLQRATQGQGPRLSEVGTLVAASGIFVSLALLAFARMEHGKSFAKAS